MLASRRRMYVEADLRDTDKVLTHAALHLDFGQPVADRLELVEPGLVPVNRWHIQDGEPEVPNYCAVARKP
jgi:hypothetical protein